MTDLRYRIRAEARRDLDAHTDYLIAQAGEQAAARFVASARLSFAAIARSPGMGVAVPSRNARLAGLRKWRVRDFPNLLIFYRESSEAIRIVRVLHAAQDWWALLDVS